MGFDARTVMWTDRYLLEVGERKVQSAGVKRRMLPPQAEPAANGPNRGVYPAGLRVQHPKNKQTIPLTGVHSQPCGASESDT